MKIAKTYNFIGFILLTVIILILPRSISAENKKFSVCVGISNYKNKPLRSSVNDANEICQRLRTDFDFAKAETLTNEEATRKNILDKIIFYQNKVSKGELFVFYYSGHGTVFPDKLSDEVDETTETKIILSRDGKLLVKQRYDSALIPFDSTSDSDGKRWKNLILDDELFELFEKFTRKGAKVIFISDSCHSGNLAKGGLMLNAKYPFKFMSTEEALGIKDLSEIEKQKEEERRKKGVLEQQIPDRNFSESYLMIASSQVNQLSSSGNPETGEEMSLFTYYFLKTLDGHKKNKLKSTYKTILETVAPKVKEFGDSIDSPQTPNFDDRFFKKEYLNTPIFSFD